MRQSQLASCRAIVSISREGISIGHRDAAKRRREIRWRAAYGGRAAMEQAVRQNLSVIKGAAKYAYRNTIATSDSLSLRFYQASQSIGNITEKNVKYKKYNSGKRGFTHETSIRTRGHHAARTAAARLAVRVPTQNMR